MLYEVITFGEPACVMFRTEALRSVGLWHETARYLIDQATYARRITSYNVCYTKLLRRTIAAAIRVAMRAFVIQTRLTAGLAQTAVPRPDARTLRGARV